MKHARQFWFAAIIVGTVTWTAGCAKFPGNHSPKIPPVASTESPSTTRDAETTGAAEDHQEARRFPPIFSIPPEKSLFFNDKSHEIEKSLGL